MAGETERLIELLNMPMEDRAEDWGWRVLEQVGDAWLKSSAPDGEPMIGPNRLAYFAYYPDTGDEGPWLIVRRSIEELTNEVLGLVFVKPGEERVEFVVTAGDLAAFRMFGTFQIPEDWNGRVAGAVEGASEGPSGHVLIGSPSEEYLPRFLRTNLAAIAQFLGIEGLEVVLVNAQDGSRSLAFRLFEGCSQYGIGLEAIYQYFLEVLPRGYAVMGWEEQFEGKGLVLG